MPNRHQWHKLSTEETFEGLEVDATGCTTSEANVRLTRYGYQKLIYTKKRNVLMCFVDIERGRISELGYDAGLAAMVGYFLPEDYSKGY